MEKHKIGSQGLVASRIGLGCMGMSEFYGNADEAESIATIHRALELGINLLDTSDIYGPYKNEELVGKAVRGRRDEAVIATKFGIVRSDDPAFRGVNGRPEYVRQSCDGSLRRLGTDYIDLYYQHRMDPDVPIEETVGAMAELVRAGKVRYIGLSEAGSKTLRRAHGVHPLTALQTEYSLWSRDPEDEIFQTVKELGIGFVAYSPLGRGFLTGRFKSPDDFAPGDYRGFTPRFQGDNFKKNLELVEKVTELAKRRGVKPGQIALAWVLAKETFITPIPGTTRRSHLEENVAAVSLSLTESELAEIEAVFPKGAASGTRYLESMMKLLNQ